MTRTADAPAERARDLAQRIRAHKAAIRRHREQLQADARQLERLREECRKRGIRLIVQSEGAGGIHGHEEDA